MTGRKLPGSPGVVPSSGRCSIAPAGVKPKRSYRSKARAMKVVRRAGGGAWPYLCECGSWHLTTTPAHDGKRRYENG